MSTDIDMVVGTLWTPLVLFNYLSFGFKFFTDSCNI